MGMSNYILDREDQFWTIADEKIGECDTFQEWHNTMSWYRGLLDGSPSYCATPEQFEEMLHGAWQDKWSEYYNWG